MTRSKDKVRALSKAEEHNREELIRLRTGAEITQKDCAELIEASLRAVQDYEQGLRRVPRGLLKLLRIELAARGLGPVEPLITLLQLRRKSRPRRGGRRSS
jgi:DNA-binding transcriptional regulator YiaG